MKIDYRTLPADDQRALPGLPYHVWEFSGGETCCEMYRESEGYRVRFPGAADFLISADSGQVSVVPTHRATSAALDHLFLNQVVPLVYSQRGHAVMHASAVAIDDVCIAFSAESGYGKSTMATSLAMAGAAFITDDGLILNDEVDHFTVTSSHPSVRLWEDSRDALGAAALPTLTAAHAHAKVRMLGTDVFASRSQPTKLARLYFLGDGEVSEVEIKPMSTADTALAIVRNSFLLELDQRSRLKTHFGQIGRLAAMNLAYTLDYPREYEYLPQVHAAIRRHIAEFGQTT